MSTLKPKILLITGDICARGTASLLIRSEGSEVEVSDTGSRALALAQTMQFDLILVDQTLPDQSGIEIVRRLRERRHAMPIVVIAGAPNLQSSFEAGAAGADAYIQGPILAEEYPNIVWQVLDGEDPARHPVRLQVSTGFCCPAGARLEHRPSFADPRVKAILRWIDRAPRTPVSELARHVSLSESRLRHLFRATIGVSISSYRRHATVQAAARLLVTTADSVERIGERLGIGDLRRFRRDFRLRFGMPPQAYRMQFRQPPSVS